MLKAKVTFLKAIMDSQELGSNAEHMVSRIFFNLEIDGHLYKDLTADITQTPGSDFEKYPLAVSAPRGYDGPFNAQAFRTAAETYYRKLIGRSGQGIRIVGASNVRMYDNTISLQETAEFVIENR